MLTGMILSSISASPLNVKREIAFGPATVFLTLAKFQRLPFELATGSDVDEFFLCLNHAGRVAIAQLRSTKRVECGMIAGQYRLTKGLNRLGGRLLIRGPR